MAAPVDPFRSARLVYRAVQGAQDDALFAQINNDRVGYMNSNHSNITLPGPSDAEGFRKVSDERLLAAVICLPQHTTIDSEETTVAGTPIGLLTLSGLGMRVAHHRNTDLSIDILPRYQGKGYGSEAIRWALDYAFVRAGLHRMRLRAFGWNEGALKLYEKLGFAFEGKEREALWHEGKWWDGWNFGMLAREWEEIKKKDQTQEQPEAQS